MRCISSLFITIRRVFFSIGSLPRIKKNFEVRREPILNLWTPLPYLGGMNLKEILADPTISFWLKDAIKTAYERDPVDALRDARWLLKMLGDRYTQIVNRDLAH
jgi:hypothetical protein